MLRDDYREIVDLMTQGKDIPADLMPTVPLEEVMNQIRFSDMAVIQGPQKYNRTTQTRILKLAQEAASPSTTNFDWADWITRFNHSLFRESPSPSLAACQELASVHPSFARALFSEAFVSCWVELSSDQQAHLAENLQRAMTQDLTLMQLMLNVAEFMSHVSDTSGNGGGSNGGAAAAAMSKSGSGEGSGSSRATVSLPIDRRVSRSCFSLLAFCDIFSPPPQHSMLPTDSGRHGAGLPHICKGAAVQGGRVPVVL